LFVLLCGALIVAVVIVIVAVVLFSTNGFCPYLQHRQTAATEIPNRLYLRPKHNRKQSKHKVWPTNALYTMHDLYSMHYNNRFACLTHISRAASNLLLLLLLCMFI